MSEIYPVTAGFVRTLTPGEVAAAQAQAAQIGNLPQRLISNDTFVYFAAFDGTNNDRTKVSLSGNLLNTNVAQLFAQAESNFGDVSTPFKGKYWPKRATGSDTVLNCKP